MKEEINLIREKFLGLRDEICGEYREGTIDGKRYFLVHTIDAGGCYAPFKMVEESLVINTSLAKISPIKLELMKDIDTGVGVSVISLCACIETKEKTQFGDFIEMWKNDVLNNHA